MLWRGRGKLIMGLVLIAAAIATSVVGPLWGQARPPRSCDEDRTYWQEYTRELAQERARLEQRLIDLKLTVSSLQEQEARLRLALAAAKAPGPSEGEQAPTSEK